MLQRSSLGGLGADKLCTEEFRETGSTGFPTTCSASWYRREMFITGLSRVCTLTASVISRWGRSWVSQPRWSKEEEEQEVQGAGGAGGRR